MEMTYLVIHRSKKEAREGAELLEVWGKVQQWLNDLKAGMKAGRVKFHYAFKGEHSGITVYEVGNPQEVERYCQTCPVKPYFSCEKYELATIEEVEKAISRYMPV
jgi:hypothetical protein